MVFWRRKKYTVNNNNNNNNNTVNNNNNNNNNNKAKAKPFELAGRNLTLISIADPVTRLHPPKKHPGFF
jgi:hypothetical protein